LRERIRGVAKGLPSRPLDDLFRLPIDRALSVAGVGTVVTGTAWSGSLARGETVRVLPSGRVGRVRTIQNHGSDLERSVPGARTAVGIAGIEREDIHRGDVLVRENEPWAATTVLDAVVTLIPSAARQLSHRGRVRVHLGSAEVLARVRLKSPLVPGQTGAIRLLLETPTVARGGDRFVLRSYSPVETIGGGWITDPDPPRRSSALEPGLTEQDPCATRGGARQTQARRSREWATSADPRHNIRRCRPSDDHGYCPATRPIGSCRRTSSSWFSRS
jgi:selenocysteine-specific elongation factor